MEQRLSFVTLGVADLPRARRFYEQLGWRGQEVDETVFFQAGGIVVVLWDRTKLTLDSGISDRQGGAFGGVVLAHNVRSQDEVEHVVAAAEAAGASVTRPPGKTFYGGYTALLHRPRRTRLGDRLQPGVPPRGGRLDHSARLRSAVSIAR